MSSSPLVIGIDSSSTACKVVAWDIQGGVAAQGRSPHPLEMPQPGWHEQPAESWWLAVQEALRQLTSQVDPCRVQALSIAHQRETFVALDAQGRPLRPAILWMDERAAPLIPHLLDLWGGERFHRLTGKPLSVNLSIAKIAWLRQYEPQVFAQAARYLDVHAYLVYRLTGEYCTGWGCADPTGLWDMLRNDWALDLLAQLDLCPDQFPPASPPGTIIGQLSPQAAQACGLPAGLPVVAGLGDGQAGGLGVNITCPGDAYLTLGTSLVCGAYSENYVTHPALRTLYGGPPGSYLLETALLGGGYTLQWFMDRFAVGLEREADAKNDSQERRAAQLAYEAQAATLPPGSQGLILLPYWNSVLGPYWDPLASGAIIGWRGHHSLAHLYRAILEGLAFEQRLNTEAIEAALQQPLQRFIVVGGGARSDLWGQILADVSGKPLYRAAAPEAAALGAGILAAAALNLHATPRHAALAMTRLQPDPFLPQTHSRAVYDELFTQVYKPLFPALQPVLQKLARALAAV